MTGIHSGFEGHAKGACDNLASTARDKLDRDQAKFAVLPPSLAPHEEPAPRTVLRGNAKVPPEE